MNRQAQASEAFFERKHQEADVRLNETQRQAVLQTEGPLLLLATPGSGKTTTMIMRIGYLVEERGISPTRIKAVTYSRTAAHDMRERYRKLFPELPPVDFSTLHSLAFEIVRESLRAAKQPFLLIEGNSEGEGAEPLLAADGTPLHKQAILRKLYRTIVGENMTDDQLEEMTTYMSYIKNKMIPRESWSTIKAAIPQAETLMQQYEQFKRTGRQGQWLLDFDDMLTYGLQALEQSTALLRKYQARYDYVLTDESQDTSLIQHAIVERLVREHNNLCVVADDDQSLYSWRGAEPGYLLQFRDVYPQAKILFMERNYRSSLEIVEAANHFIARNTNRYKKNMFTKNESHRPIMIRCFSNYRYQAKYLVQEVQKCQQLGDVAILYRNNASSIVLMNELDRAGVPFYMKDTDNRFFSHWVVEDILNFMRMTYTDKRADLLEKIHMKLNGYISKQQMAALLTIQNGESVFDNLFQHVALHDYQIQPLQDCQRIFGELANQTPLKVIRAIREQLGYEKALQRLSEWLGYRHEFLIGILNTLEEIAEGLDTMEQFAKRLQDLKQQLQVARSRQGQQVVTLSTMHSAKGLEFERVYLIDLVEGILPNKEDVKSDALMEEARRLFYVGMTRAKRHLEMITYRERDGQKMEQSRFVTAVKQWVAPQSASGTQTGKAKSTEAVARSPHAIGQCQQLQVGTRVQHAKYGAGIIVGCDDQMVRIKFDQEEKRLSVALCLEKGLLEKVQVEKKAKGG